VGGSAGVAKLGVTVGGGDAAATITNGPHHNAESAGAIMH
jgi:hypothetical protein